MINVSRKYLETMENRRDFYATAEITFSDGREKSVEKKDLFISGNFVVTSPELSSFPLGVFVSRMITLSLVNDDDRWSDYDFYGAKILLKTKFDLDDGTTETINVGTFTVITPESYGTTVGITAMDDSYKADKEYSTNLPYPAAARLVLAESCYSCGITLKTPSFLNSDFVIPTKPENITHRQLIGLIAMLACGNAVMDEYNRLSIKSYDFFGFTGDLDGGVFDLAKPYETGDSADGGSFLPWSDGDNFDGGEFGDRNNVHVLHEFKGGLTIGVDDVVITGVQMASEDADKNTSVHLYGEQGYVLQLDNRIAVGKEAQAVRLIGRYIVGLRFRPFSGDHIAYPLAEFMDLAYIADFRNNIYQTVITDISFSYFGYTTLKCSADSPIRNSSTYYGNETKAIVEARKLVEQEKTDRELAVENLANQLANSSGLYMTTEKQDDRSTIYYMHNKPTLAESMIVWKLTAEAFGISTDGGKTYPYGLDVNGVAILSKIYAIGIDAQYINTGTLTVGGKNSSNVAILILDANGKEIGRWDKNGITASKGTFSGELNAATGTFSGELEAASGTFSGTVSAGAITGSEIDGGTITGSTISGGTIKGSAINGGTITGAQISIETSNGRVSLYSDGFTYELPSGEKAVFGNYGAVVGVHIFDSFGSYIARFTEYLLKTQSVSSTHISADNIFADYIKASDIYGTLHDDSDERLKTSILASQVNALETINGIQTYEFDWVETGEHEDIKFIAQQLETVNPAFVHVDKDTGCYGVKQMEMIPYLVKAVQELSEQVESLQAEIAELKGQSIDRTSRKARTEWKPTPYTMEEKREFVNTLSKKRRNAANGD